MLLPACGDDSSKVGATLKEFSIALDDSSIDSGERTFEVKNDGTEKHEFVVLKTDLSLTDLPTTDDGSVDEEGSGVEVVDEAEDISAGDSVDLKVDLKKGTYVVVCNVVEDENGETLSHYEQGMRASLTVD